jgi:L-fuculose-phosphate aldolase
VRATELLEWAATVYWRAKTIGEPRVLDGNEVAAVLEHAVSRGYGTTREA